MKVKVITIVSLKLFSSFFEKINNYLVCRVLLGSFLAIDVNKLCVMSKIVTDESSSCNLSKNCTILCFASRFW